MKTIHVCLNTRLTIGITQVYAPLCPRIALSPVGLTADNIVNSLEDQLLDVIRDLNDNVVELSNAISSGITPAIDAAASIARVDITVGHILQITIKQEADNIRSTPLGSLFLLVSLHLESVSDAWRTCSSLALEWF
jgi:hypothetical protein